MVNAGLAANKNLTVSGDIVPAVVTSNHGAVGLPVCAHAGCTGLFLP